MQPVSPWKFVLLLFLVAGAVYYLYPSVQWYSMPAPQRNALRSDRTDELDAEIARLLATRDASGLSEEEKQAINENLSQLRKQREDERRRLEELQDKALNMGLDLQGGIHLVLQVDLSGLPDDDDWRVDDAVNGVIEKIRERIDRMGVKEPVIQRHGRDRIIVQVAGVVDPARVEDIIGKTAQLEFKLVVKESQAEVLDFLQAVDEELQADIFPKVESKPGQSDVYVTEENIAYVREVLFKPETNELKDEIRDIMVATGRRGLDLAISNLREADTVYPEGKYRELLMLKARTELGGDTLKDAYVQLQPAGLRQEPYVSLEFDSAGTRKFRSVTGQNVNERLAILLDNTVYSAPVIREKIPYGQAQITGNFTVKEARDLAVVLKAGALPASARVIENRTVDPLLGRDSIEKGLKAGLIGAACVVVFMVLYYLLCGVVADFALVLNILFLLGCLALFKATLTLPGIAGVILFIGMAVDANVLIFERIREEIAGKQDRAIPLSVDRGYSRAFTTILDANVTTLITALVLFQFGTGPVRGFAVTLSLGILISMFTAIVVTRMIIDFWLNNLHRRKLAVGKTRVFAASAYNFLAARHVALILSILVIATGMGVFYNERDRILGIDFAGGTLLRLGFDREIDPGELRIALADAGITSEPRIQQEHSIAVETVPGATEAAPAMEYVYQVRFKEEIGSAAIGQATPVVVPSLEDQTDGTGPMSLTDSLAAHFPDAEAKVLDKGVVSGQVSKALQRQAFMAILYSTILIMVYVSLRFQFKFAVAAVAALFHDVLMSVSLFAFARGAGLNVEINLPEVAALLTIFGYSINDTIVVFDRIRENLRPGQDLVKTINASVNQTLSRTIITSLTTLTTVTMLLLLGGEVIFHFALILIFGLLSGTYSSIFIASPVVVLWERWRAGKGVAGAARSTA